MGNPNSILWMWMNVLHDVRCFDAFSWLEPEICISLILCLRSQTCTTCRHDERYPNIGRIQMQLIQISLSVKEELFHEKVEESSLGQLMIMLLNQGIISLLLVLTNSAKYSTLTLIHILGLFVVLVSVSQNRFKIKILSTTVSLR